jgi:hypothetical protein
VIVEVGFQMAIAVKKDALMDDTNAFISRLN